MLSPHTPDEAYGLGAYIHSTFQNLLLLSCSRCIKILIEYTNRIDKWCTYTHAVADMPGKILIKGYLNCSLLHPDFHFPRLYRSFTILTVSILSCQAGREETKGKGW